MVFPPIWGEKNGGILSMRMQVILLDSSFARPGSAPIWGGKKGEFRDWTRKYHIDSIVTKISKNVGLIAKLRHSVPRPILLNIYNSLIHPY